MKTLLNDIRKCTICQSHLPHPPNPVFSASVHSKIVIIGQAPGSVVNRTGIPWDDKSGENLRAWLQMDKPTFYNPEIVALIPMGFCYPGKGKSGDLPPRPECAPQWHHPLLNQMKEVKLTLLIGQYAQAYYLGGQLRPTLTETVKNYRQYLPAHFVLPHPSPRNNIWKARNPWFEQEVVPALRKSIREII